MEFETDITIKKKQQNVCFRTFANTTLKKFVSEDYPRSNINSMEKYLSHTLKIQKKKR